MATSLSPIYRTIAWHSSRRPRGEGSRQNVFFEIKPTKSRQMTHQKRKIIQKKKEEIRQFFSILTPTHRKNYGTPDCELDDVTSIYDCTTPPPPSWPPPSPSPPKNHQKSTFNTTPSRKSNKNQSSAKWPIYERFFCNLLARPNSWKKMYVSSLRFLKNRARRIYEKWKKKQKKNPKNLELTAAPRHDDDENSRSVLGNDVSQESVEENSRFWGGRGEGRGEERAGRSAKKSPKLP